MKLKENKENKDVKNYLSNGYIIKNIKQIKSLDYIRKIFIKEIIKIFPDQKNKNEEEILNNIHKKIKVKNLNEFRLKIFNNVNMNEKFKMSYYNLSKEFLDQIVGNELVMQSRINLSIQMPKDTSSLLPIHADTWSGVSPFGQGLCGTSAVETNYGDSYYGSRWRRGSFGLFVECFADSVLVRVSNHGQGLHFQCQAWSRKSVRRTGSDGHNQKRQREENQIQAGK